MNDLYILQSFQQQLMQLISNQKMDILSRTVNHTQFKIVILHTTGDEL